MQRGVSVKCRSQYFNIGNRFEAGTLEYVSPDY